MANAKTNKAVTAVCLLLASLVLAVGLQAQAGQAWAKGEPKATSPYEGAADSGLADGDYLIEVAMEGGTGRATIASPAKLSVEDGLGAATIEWSSPNYDYMVVNGKQYLAEVEGDSSTFQIPVTAYDEPVPVVADTTAMSEPHEIDYTFTFDSASIKEYDASASSQQDAESGDGGANASGGSGSSSASDNSNSSNAADSSGGDAGTASSIPWIVLIACVIGAAILVGIIIGVMRGYKNR